MTITIQIPLSLLVAVPVWMLIGTVIALRFAISTQAFLTLLVFWPLFVVLAAFSPAINWWVNREFDD